MAQEFVIKSQKLEDKINQLLPSQGGFQAGVDLSASTQIVPIIDLTESAEGSNVRQDIQTAISFTTSSAFNVAATTTTLINTTGYFRVFGSASVLTVSSGNPRVSFILNDGVTDKTIWGLDSFNLSTLLNLSESYDFIVFLEAGHILKGFSSTSGCKLVGSTRQIADISGNLINP